MLALLLNSVVSKSFSVLKELNFAKFYETSICQFLTTRKSVMNLVVSRCDLILSPLPFCYRKKTKWSQFSCVWPVIDSPITITYHRKTKKTFLVFIYILIVLWFITILQGEDMRLSMLLWIIKTKVCVIVLSAEAEGWGR